VTGVGGPVDGPDLPAPPRALSDLGAVALAVSAALGAAVAVPVPLPFGVALTGVAMVARRPVLLVVAVGLLTSGLAAGAWAGLVPPEPGPIEGWATVRRDPDRVTGAVRVELELGGRHYDAFARGPAGGRLGRLATGDSAFVRGRVERGEVPRFARVRHVVAGLTVEEVVDTRAAGPPWSWANGVRSWLAGGVAHLPVEARTVFTGIVLGDDRGQPPEVADDFRGAGLTHLLVVSGQNVAFVLLAAAPVLVRLRPPVRLAATVVVLAAFALLTRFEPAVLRATAMAAVATLAVVSGRPSTGVRTLALAVVIVLLVDPLLVGSLGFGLSVAASGGIVVLARPLAALLPGPRWLALPLAVTLAAQVAVAPLLAPVAGGLPLATVPANLAAEPLAAVIVVWGMTAGVVAGLAGPGLAAVIHVPTGLALTALLAVARWAAALPLGAVGAPAALAGAGLTALAAVAGRGGRRVVGGALVAAAVVVVAGPAVVPSPPPSGPEVSLTSGAVLWLGPPPAGGRVLVVTSDARAERVLEALRRRRVDAVDVVVSVHGSSSAAAVVRAVRSRVSVAEGGVWAPVDHRVPGAATPPQGRFRVGGLEVDVTGDRPRLEVEVGVAGESPTGRPPGGGG
jgi:competence protein ComEC